MKLIEKLFKLITINLCLAFFTTIAFTQNPCREADSLALVEFYNSMTFKSDAQWDLAQPMDSWPPAHYNNSICWI